MLGFSFAFSHLTLMLYAKPIPFSDIFKIHTVLIFWCKYTANMAHIYLSLVYRLLLKCASFLTRWQMSVGFWIYMNFAEVRRYVATCTRCYVLIFMSTRNITWLLFNGSRSKRSFNSNKPSTLCRHSLRKGVCPQENFLVRLPMFVFVLKISTVHIMAYFVLTINSSRRHFETHSDAS